MIGVHVGAIAGWLLLLVAVIVHVDDVGLEILL
jgi:hypothetical protein